MQCTDIGTYKEALVHAAKCQKKSLRSVNYAGEKKYGTGN